MLYPHGILCKAYLTANRNLLTRFHLFIFSLLFFSVASAQDTGAIVPCEQKDLPELINKWRGKTSDKPKKKGSLLLMPIISSNPATGLAFGVAGQYAFRGKQPHSLYSSIAGSATYTTKNQVLVQLKNNIYVKDDKIFLSGDWRALWFSQSTYGLGTSAPEGAALEYQYSLNGWEGNIDSLIQPMKFNLFRFYQTISWQVRKSMYLGFGYHLDVINSIVDERLDTTGTSPLYTSHYLYSRYYGFNIERYLVSGLSLDFVIDKRDNQVNPYKGYYVRVNNLVNPKALGSKYNANLLNLEFRGYHSFSKRNPRNLIGFWFLGNFSQSGRMPYLTLPALGYDQRGRAGRGYTQGRFRGTNMVYGETEYRFSISPCGGILGGVLFANLTSTSNPYTNEKLFDYVAPGYGFGFRIMVDKKSRTNLQIDFGFGQKSSGVYFGASETF